MSQATKRARGMDRVWRLTAEGYQIIDVDSDECFVGIRLRRGSDSLTLLLTKEDFAEAFPAIERLAENADTDVYVDR